MLLRFLIRKLLKLVIQSTLKVPVLYKHLYCISINRIICTHDRHVKEYKSDESNILCSFQSGRRWRLKPTHASIIAWHIIAFIYYFTVPNCSAESTNKVRLLDLSHTFDETTVYWVTAKQLNLTITHNGTDPTNTYW